MYTPVTIVVLAVGMSADSSVKIRDEVLVKEVRTARIHTILLDEIILVADKAGPIAVFNLPTAEEI